MTWCLVGDRTTAVLLFWPTLSRHALCNLDLFWVGVGAVKPSRLLPVYHRVDSTKLKGHGAEAAREPVKIT